MLKKLIHIILILCAFFVIIIVCAAVVYRLLMPADKMKADLLKQIRGMTMHEAKLDVFTVSFFSGIRAENLALSKGLNFRSGTMLKVRKISFIPDILPMFKGEARISGISIENPELELGSEGIDIGGLIQSVQNMKRPAHQRKYAPMLWTVSEFRISGGKAKFSGTSDFAVSDFNFLMRGLTKERPFKGGLSFVFKGKNGSVTVNSDFVVDVKGQKITVESFNIKGAKGDIGIAGRIEGFDEPRLDLLLTGGNNSINSVAGQLLGLPKIMFGKGGLNLNITGTFDNIKIRELK